MALIDADGIAYRAACSCQKVLFGSVYLDEDEMISVLEHEIDKAVAACWADDMVLCLSDASENNWRLGVLPSYKSNRDPSKKPLGLPTARAYLLDKRKAWLRPTLEADDVLGILATNRKLLPGTEKIIFTADKDLLQIPGLVCRGGEIVEVTREAGDLWHMTQTLMGDPTDGYKGCPGIGPKKAAAILEAAEGDYWPAVVAAFEAKGLTEEDALVQARVARMCRVSDYDFTAKQVRLWNPPSK
ncbi:hypothetical protein NON00_02360 [Roseomonas sp. GC11]|uniref:hypothetical protein n=1 Tax=Roseomonas sp. GC11 TaxID=2950546 RepID=UPI00210F130A|nr:hypothetical protein [Roseomonas sp. GC11]